MSDIPKVHTWRGKDIQELTREELLEALKDVCGLYWGHLNSKCPVCEARQSWRNT